MKRDFELIRKLVLAAEESPTGFVQKKLKIEGYTDEETGYHQYLIVQAGLAQGIDRTNLGSTSPDWMITHLTSAGHDFAEAARNDSLWQKTMGHVKTRGGTVTIDVLKDLLISFLRGTLFE